MAMKDKWYNCRQLQLITDNWVTCDDPGDKTGLAWSWPHLASDHPELVTAMLFPSRPTILLCSTVSVRQKTPDSKGRVTRNVLSFSYPDCSGDLAIRTNICSFHNPLCNECLS